MSYIDYESVIFNQIATALRTEFDGVFVTGEAIDIPAKFPAVSIVEKTNTTHANTQISGVSEYSSVMYEVNVFTNLTAGKKTQCKQIISAISAQFEKIGLVRIFCEPIENFSDKKTYRMTARFKGVLSSDGYSFTE